MHPASSNFVKNTALSVSLSCIMKFFIFSLLNRVFYGLEFRNAVFHLLYEQKGHSGPQMLTWVAREHEYSILLTNLGVK